MGYNGVQRSHLFLSNFRSWLWDTMEYPEKSGTTQSLAMLEEGYGIQCRIAKPLILTNFRSWLWDTMEYPEKSGAAQFFAVFSLSVVFVSTFTFVMSTFEVL